MRSEGHKWRLFPQPTVKELYPNMKNERDGNFRKIKVEMNKINDITEVWMCGVKKKN